MTLVFAVRKAEKLVMANRETKDIGSAVVRPARRFRTGYCHGYEEGWCIPEEWYVVCAVVLGDRSQYRENNTTWEKLPFET